METTQILLTIEFTVLAAALISLFVKSRANRNPGFGFNASARHIRNLPQGSARKPLRRELASRKHAKTSVEPPLDESPTGDAELNIPIPWGWPHYQDYRAIRMERPTASEAMNSFVKCLVREKNLVAAKSTDPRINIILKALLEERRVPVSAQRPLLAKGQDRVPGQILPAH